MYGQAVIPDDWEGEFCCYEVYWPNSPQWLAILRGTLSMPAQGRFWDKNTGTITEAQAVIKQTLDDNLHLREVIMPCSNEVAQGLLAIAAAMTNGGGCGCGNGGDVESTSYCFTGSSVNVQTVVSLDEDNQWVVFGTQPIAEVPEVGYPEGYDSVEEYNSDKCAKATKMVDDWTATIANMGNVNNWLGVGGAVAILACIVGLIVVPPAVIPLLLFALTANVGISALLIGLANQMEEHREELICILYEGENVQVIITSLSDTLDILIGLIPAEGAIAVALKSIALWLISSNTLNYLFTSKAKELYPAAECVCQDCLFKQQTSSGQDYSLWSTWEFGDTLTPFISPDYSGPTDAYVIAVSLDSLRDFAIDVTGFTPFPADPTTRAGTTPCANAVGESNVVNSTSLVTPISQAANLTLASMTDFTCVITEDV